MTRLVAVVSLGAALLGPLSGCGAEGDTLPCPVPTSSTTGTPGPAQTPIVCHNSSGVHYIWLPERGGWVQSDDGIHPNSGAQGVGEDEGHGGSDAGHGGVGEGHGGGGHGGGDGG